MSTSLWHYSAMLFCHNIIVQILIGDTNVSNHLETVVIISIFCAAALKLCVMHPRF